MQPPTPVGPGTVIGGDFRVERVLGAGGFGTVYVATQLSTDRARALKVLHPRLETDPDSRRRFLEEARVGGRIGSEHVVDVIAAGFDEATRSPWLAMELLEGEDLQQRVAGSGPLEASLARELFAQLAHALGAAHDKGIVHRDLKPENLFLCRPRGHGDRTTLKVLDFGLAKSLELGRTAATATAAIGSPLFMAPEQTSEGAAIRASTDVWALGLMAFYVLTGRDYWRAASGSGNMQALFAELLVHPIEPASVRAASLGAAPLPANFDPWFARCVDRDPASRFANARACLHALDAVLVARPDPYAATAEATPALIPWVADATPPPASEPTRPLVPWEPNSSPPSPISPGTAPERVPEVADLPGARGTGTLVMGALGAAVVGAGLVWIGLYAIAGSEVDVEPAAAAVSGETSPSAPTHLVDPSPTPVVAAARTPTPPPARPSSRPVPAGIPWGTGLNTLPRPADLNEATQRRFFLASREGTLHIRLDGQMLGAAPQERLLAPGVHTFAVLHGSGCYAYDWFFSGSGVAQARGPAADSCPSLGVARPGYGSIRIQVGDTVTAETGGSSLRTRSYDNFVRPGTHRLTLRDSATGRSETLDVRVADQGRTSVMRNLFTLERDVLQERQNAARE